MYLMATHMILKKETVIRKMSDQTGILVKHSAVDVGWRVGQTCCFNVTAVIAAAISIFQHHKPVVQCFGELEPFKHIC